MPDLSEQFIEAASWRIACELMRRHAARLRLIESHPGGGQYDCLSFFDRNTKEHVLDLNRVGSAHGFLAGQTMPDVWRECSAASDFKTVVDAVERTAGLKAPASLPQAGREVVTYRFVAEWLSSRLFGRERWECRNGYLDSSACPGAPSQHFAKFPLIAPRRAVREPDDLLGIADYRFWFLLRDHEPVIALEPHTATAWNRAGECFQLFERFKRERRIAPLLLLVARDFLA